MMSVVHAPTGSDDIAHRPPERDAGTVELYQPPTRIGGGWNGGGGDGGGGSSSRGGGGDSASKALSRAKAANARTRGSPAAEPSQASQVPVVVHVPLPDLDQPVVSAAPNEAMGAEHDGAFV